MKRIKLILKGVLLWITTFAVIIFIAGIDSIVDNGIGYFIQSIIVSTAMCYFCYEFISKEELKKITMYKLLNKLMKK